MNKPSYPDWQHQVQWLPAIDWNVKLFGGHERAVDRHWAMPQESHIGFEIILVLEGSQETVMGGTRYILHANDIILIPPGITHRNRCESDQGMRYFCVHFNVDDPHFRQEMIKHNRIIFRSGTAENVRLRSLLDHWLLMVRRGGGHSTEDRFRLQAQLFELLGMLASFSIPADAQQAEPAAPASVQYAKAIAEAMKAQFNPHQLDRSESPDNRVRIDRIAASLGISTGYALEVFRKVYGLSPRQYLSELKLHEAKVLIQQPDLSLKEIAERLGYAHLSHFSRQFKRWTGMSPLQFREQGR
ncbi:AraC-like DNA-binding protein [Paenibacillus phyllosphaerae]|uniref:AraC-like DNA-binding protein n=1 Tax=Paenibacillus phyllosphaerae TaxID=274593 RepID=A0A7W5FPW9_9BACL|nr:AraC family transcriptional regulator [Paenibacillus phyllosphaerae]MBB3112825.1 AraC-like DNA-binding protein [Paenibacillus phyllosphaerae]